MHSKADFQSSFQISLRSKSWKLSEAPGWLSFGDNSFLRLRLWLGTINSDSKSKFGQLFKNLTLPLIQFLIS